MGLISQDDDGDENEDSEGSEEGDDDDRVVVGQRVAPGDKAEGVRAALSSTPNEQASPAHVRDAEQVDAEPPLLLVADPDPAPPNLGELHAPAERLIFLE